MSPHLSVIIPAYNHERFIGVAIDSVLKQTYPHFELIIIDDGSTDRTYEIVQRYTDQRIRAQTQINMDAPSTINRGIEMARGEYITILNSDDFYAPDRLEKMLAFVQRHQLVCAFSDIQPVMASGQAITSARHYWNQANQANQAFYQQTGDLFATLLHANMMVTTSNLFITHEAVKKIGVFSSLRYLHDYDYILRVARAYEDRVGFCHESLLRYRIHGSNTLKQGAIEAREQDLELIKKYVMLCVPETERLRIEAGRNHLVRMEKELRRMRLLRRFPILNRLADVWRNVI